MVNQSGSQLNSVFSALADPTRRAILERLLRQDATVKELAEPFAVSLPAITKHLNVLENAGLIKREREGRVRRCRLDAAPLQMAAQWLSHYRAFWSDRLDALEEFLSQIPENQGDT